MTMPHLMNCAHSETGWCLNCVKEQWEELRAEQVNAGKYELCLQAAAQRLQSVLPIGEVKAIGLMEVPCAIDELMHLQKWHTPEDKPDDGDSIWVEVLEHDGKHTHIDYAVVWLDVDGLRIRRFEQNSRLFCQPWPPDDVLRWCRCEMPQVDGGGDDE